MIGTRGVFRGQGAKMRALGDDRKIAQRKQEQRWREWVKKKIEFYISTGKWDKVSIAQLNAWLANFDDEGQKYALTLLNHFIYYSSEDVKRLCQYAIAKVVFKNQLLNVDQSHSFCCEDEVLRQELTYRIQETRVVPVLSEGNPTESGNAIARVYTTTGLINENQVIRPDEIIPCIYQGSCKRFLFVDDFMGTSEQLVSFWNGPYISLGMSGQRGSLARISAQHTNISFEYIALVATAYGLRDIEERVPGLKLFFCEKLSDEYRIFSNDSIFFDTPDDRQACESYLESLCRDRHIDTKGYHGLDFAIAFHHGAPDSCLPLFWEKSLSWTPLFQRRM
jgi:hypothetical protein